MPLTRVFLDWNQPSLQVAAEYLIARYQAAPELDLGGVLVVTPGKRAGRRLLEILVQRADEADLTLTPPQIITESHLPEQLYIPKRPFANDLTLRWAWVAALRQMPRERLRPLIPHPPETGDAPRWLQLGAMLSRLHVELAADALDCAAVRTAAGQIDGFIEHERWQVLEELQRIYLRTLDDLDLWDVQTARLVAIEKRELTTERDIVLVGMADLLQAHRLMLAQVADRVTSLILAPETLADRFDELGCLLPEAWAAANVPIRDDQIARVDGPADQAEEVTRWLASLGGRYRADQITIALPDEGLAQHLQRQLAQFGLASRWHSAQCLAQTGPFRLLKLGAEYAARRRFRDLAALVRHPDVSDWLTPQLAAADTSADLLTALDEFACTRIPAQIDEDRLEKEPELAAVKAVVKAMHKLLEPLSGPPKTLASWGVGMRAVLAEVYGERLLDKHSERDRVLVESLDILADSLADLLNIPESVQQPLDACQACRLLLETIAQTAIPPAAGPDAVELLGWLELPLDDAPATIVTTFNDGFVPTSSHAHAFLPNRLQQQLGMLHNDRRLARDAYAVSLLVASRKDVRFVVAHRDADRNPLIPSRLLFACPEEQVVDRALWFFSDLPKAGRRPNLLSPPTGPRPKSLLERPMPRRMPGTISSLSVTRFKDYLACPYRFYLRHVLRLTSFADTAAELDGSEFGNLVHSILEQFGRSEEARDLRTAEKPKHIVEYLEHELDRFSAARYGKHPRPAVRVQIEQIRMRLRVFSEWQASRSREGWRIVHTEDSELSRRLETQLVVDGEPFTITGRIDRIDYHERLRRLAVLDYKTSDRGEWPQATHCKGEDWIDLQLPLYRHLLKGANLPVAVVNCEQIDLGYIITPKDLGAIGLALAEWDSAALQRADEEAFRVIRALREQRFWPPADRPPPFCDELAAICQDRRLGASFLHTEEEDVA